jgi:hypothetical protein
MPKADAGVNVAQGVQRCSPTLSAGARAAAFRPLTGQVIDLKQLLSAPGTDKPGFAPGTLSDFAKQQGDRMFVPVRCANWKWVFNTLSPLYRKH